MYFITNNMALLSRAKKIRDFVAGREMKTWCVLILEIPFFKEYLFILPGTTSRKIAGAGTEMETIQRDNKC